MKKVLFALVGPSGCGKTTLIQGALKACPDILRMMRSVTTRPKRPNEDDITYRFVSDAEFGSLLPDMVQLIKFAGFYYGNTRNEVNELLANHHGIIALTEKGVKNFRAAGYEVVAIKIQPRGRTRAQALPRDKRRQQADRERERIEVQFQKYLPNVFDKKDGKERAIKLLIKFIRGFAT